jgi:hypothetical protein
MTEEIASLKEFLQVTGTAYNPRKNKSQWDRAFQLYNQAKGTKLKNNCSGCRGKVYKWFMAHE